MSQTARRHSATVKCSRKSVGSHQSKKTPLRDTVATEAALVYKRSLGIDAYLKLVNEATPLQLNAKGLLARSSPTCPSV